MSGPYSFLKSVRIRDQEELRFKGKAVLDTYEDGFAYLSSSFPLHANLFASPEFRRSEDGTLETVAWYGTNASQTMTWRAMDQASKIRIAGIFRGFLAELLDRARAGDDPRARLLLCWICCLSLDDDLLIANGQPLITNWGLVPTGTLDIADKLAQHLMFGAGQFFPKDHDVHAIAELILDGQLGDEADSDPESPDPEASEPVIEQEPVAQADGPPISSVHRASEHASSGDVDPDVPSAATPASPRASAPGGAALPPFRDEEHPARWWHACWFPVLIANGVALLILLILLLPGVLIYPAFSGASSFLTDEIIGQSEQALRLRAETLRTELNNRSCPAPATLPPPEVIQSEIGDQKAQLTPSQEVEGSTDTNTATPHTSIIPFLEETTVLVVAGNETVGLSSGSGFFIAPNLVVTNRHVIEPAHAGQVLVVNKSLGGARKAKVIALSDTVDFGEQDYALVELLGKPVEHYLPVAADIEKGNTIYAAGFPAIFMETDEHFLKLLAGMVTSAPDMVVTQGIVTVMQDSPAGNRMVLHSADISPGNSGGPLVDRCGRVIGVNTFIKTSSKDQMRLNFALKSDSLAAFLDANGVPLSLQQTPCGQTGPDGQSG